MPANAAVECGSRGTRTGHGGKDKRVKKKRHRGLETGGAAGGRWSVGLVAACFWLASFVGAACALELAPYKDGLFAYPGLLSGEAGDAFVIVDYKKQRDIHRRDQVWEQRVYGNYVSLFPNRAQAQETLDVSGHTLHYMRVGAARAPRMIVVYVHGQGGNRFQGVNDWTFGGNFNRIKNLMARNGGVYLSPDIRDFGARGAADVAALIRAYDGGGRAPVFVACGSAGGEICWRLARDGDIAARLGGLLFMGATQDEGFFGSPAYRRRVPLYIGHGSDDTVFDWRERAAFFDRLMRRTPTYPAKFALFQTGSHGTPIRMTDWRLVLNWMLRQS